MFGTSTFLIIYLFFHLSWLPLFFVAHMGTSIAGALIFYGCIAAWFSLGAYIWQRLVRTVVLLPLFFFLLANHSTPFCKGIRGYPLANPLLPVAWLVVSQQKMPAGQWMKVLLGGGGSPGLTRGLAAGPPLKGGGNSYWLYPLLPDAGHHQLSRAARAQRIYQRLNEIPDPPEGRGVILSPESFFPHEVTEDEKARWRSVLPSGVEWWLGTMSAAKNGGGSHQIIEKMHHNSLKTPILPIRSPYEKKLCIDLFEECDESRRFHRICKNIFRKSIGGVAVAREGDEKNRGLSGGFFSDIPVETLLVARRRELIKMLEQGSSCRILICAELFWPPTPKRGASIVFANERWFPSWVQWLMQAGAAWRALVDREPVLWVGQGECVLYTPPHFWYP